MLFELFVAVGIYSAYRHYKKISTRTAVGRSENVERRCDALGAAGEAAAQAKLRQALHWLCGDDFYLHDGPLVIEHAPGTEFPTAEIDHLAVTPFGIFVFETKHWSGSIAPSTRRGFLTRTALNGQQEDRRCPTHQNRSKLLFIRDQLPPIWPVAGAGIFTSRDSKLDPRLHADLLSLDDIPHWLRAKRDAFGASKSVNIVKATTALLKHADSRSDALEAHKQTVAKVIPQHKR